MDTIIRKRPSSAPAELRPTKTARLTPVEAPPPSPLTALQQALLEEPPSAPAVRPMRTYVEFSRITGDIEDTPLPSIATQRYLIGRDRDDANAQDRPIPDPKLVFVVLRREYLASAPADSQPQCSMIGHPWGTQEEANEAATLEVRRTRHGGPDFTIGAHDVREKYIKTDSQSIVQKHLRLRNANVGTVEVYAFKALEHMNRRIVPYSGDSWVPETVFCVRQRITQPEDERDLLNVQTASTYFLDHDAANELAVEQYLRKTLLRRRRTGVDVFWDMERKQLQMWLQATGEPFTKSRYNEDGELVEVCVQQGTMRIKRKRAGSTEGSEA